MVVVHKNKGFIYLTVIALLVLFFTDSITSIAQRYRLEINRFSLVPRAFIEFAILWYFLFFTTIVKKKISVLFLFPVLLITVFSIGYGVYITNVADCALVETIILLNKYIVFFLVFAFFMNVFYNQEKHTLSSIFLTYEFIIIVNTICCIVGAIFSITIFSSYSFVDFHSMRFGYKGLIPAQNEATLFALIAECYGLYLWHTKRKVLILFCSIIMCFLIGPKGALALGVILPIIYLSKYHKGIVFFLCVILIILFCIFILFNSDYFFQIGQLLKESVFLSSYFFRMEKQNIDFLTVLLSGRNTFITERFVSNIQENWTIVNWFFGGQNQINYTVEMDLFDLFSFFGIMGMLIWIVGTIKCFLFLDSSIRNLFIFSFFIVAALGGHLFTSAVNSLYICVLMLRTKNEEGITNSHFYAVNQMKLVNY